MREVAGCPGTIIFHLSPSQTIIAEPGCQNCGADTFPTTPPLAIRVTDSEAMVGGGGLKSARDTSHKGPCSHHMHVRADQGHVVMHPPRAAIDMPIFGSPAHAPGVRPCDKKTELWGRARPEWPGLPPLVLPQTPAFPTVSFLSLPSSSSLRPPRQMIGSLALLLALPHPPSHPFLRPSPSRLRGREERCVSANSLSLSPACRQPPAAHWAPSYRHPYNQPWPEGRGIRDACPPSRVDALSLP